MHGLGDARVGTYQRVIDMAIRYINMASLYTEMVILSTLPVWKVFESIRKMLV